MFSCPLNHSAIKLSLTSICRDNSKLCSCGGDRQIFYWDVSTGRVIRKFRGHDSEVCSLCKKEGFSFYYSARFSEDPSFVLDSKWLWDLVRVIKVFLRLDIILLSFSKTTLLACILESPHPSRWSPWGSANNSLSILGFRDI